ncbi:hypothetical protein [Dialister succinatiphilus]|uniref:hypothetical protein n=1 Tax=Dialister succinatiphilus TaxID=487173 RepID=UPI003F81B276
MKEIYTNCGDHGEILDTPRRLLIDDDEICFPDSREDVQTTRQEMAYKWGDVLKAMSQAAMEQGRHKDRDGKR